MRLTRSIEATTLLYLLAYVPYMYMTRMLSTIAEPQLGRPLSGLETLPFVLMTSTLMLGVYVWRAGWWRSAHQVSIGSLRLPRPTRWTFMAGIGTSFVLFTVPLSLTFEGVSIPFMQLLMRGDVLLIAPLADLLFGRKVRWYSWVALALVCIGLSLSVYERGGLHLPPLALFAVVLYGLGYFIRLAVMTRVAKNGDENALRGYFVEEKMVAMPLSVVVLALIALTPLASQGHELSWGFKAVWSSAVLPQLFLLALIFTLISVLSALILLDPRENTYCVPFERAASIVAGTATAYLLTLVHGQAPPTHMEIIGTVLLIAAIALLTFGPRWRRAPVSDALAINASDAR